MATHSNVSFLLGNVADTKLRRRGPSAPQENFDVIPIVDQSSIVIAGYAFRLPGAQSPSELADALLHGETKYSVFPSKRIDPEMYFDPKAPGGEAKIYSILGGHLPEEERLIDGRPLEGVHGWLLDTLERALDSAQLQRSALRGEPVPVFIAHSRGGGRALYDAALMAVAQDLLPYLALCSHPSEYTYKELKQIAIKVRAGLRDVLAVGVASDRAVHRIPALIAETLGTNEKVLIVDGNCTGGLIALELAAREVKRGAPFAIAGALSYIDVVNQVIYSNSRLLSSEGCFPFLDTCSGTVISDGVVVLVLTTLERARKSALPIFGVVRGVGGANDGAVERYMLTPNARGHAVAIQRAHRRAAVSASQIGLFFAHGSGTKAGDMVEGNVFGDYVKANCKEDEPRPVPVLSVKGNVGHCKEASGLASVVALLSLFEAERICPPVRVDGKRATFNHHAHITVGDTARAWPADGPPRIGGVSAIASGGQNYHAVIEGPPTSSFTRASRLDSCPTDWRADPIAIVGLASAFASALNLKTFWRSLIGGRSLFRRRMPSPRWTMSVREEFAPSEWAEAHSEIYANWGAPLEIDASTWLKNAELYAERPFNILRHDPLHFLIVDLARTAASGYVLEAGSNIGVVVAADHCSDYGLQQVAAARLPEIEHQLLQVMRATGRDGKEVNRTVSATMKLLAADLPELSSCSLFNISPSFLAARIARAFDLTGPTCAMEAGGAASSFAALDVACGRLASREVEAVFWGTADRRLGPLRYADECSLGYLSRGSRPTAFSVSADGYLPGEGSTVCLLRRLSDAKRRGDKIYGVIRSIGSAFAPVTSAHPLLSSTAMATAIRRAYDQCDVSPEALGFVECFGSGVPASDQAEVLALKEAMGARPVSLPISSVMPNVGHAGAAAGAASLFKALLSLSTNTLPATLGVTKPIVSEHDRLHVVTEPQILGSARYAGINAAGAGGNHYHVVLEVGSDPIEVIP
jgi:acyl transferase domain-containing protein